MQLDLCLDVGGDDGHGKHVGEVMGQVGRVDTLDVATGKLSERAQTFKVALVTLDRYNINGDTGGASDLTNSLVELSRCSDISLCVALIPCTQTDVSETIGADNNRGAS